MFYDDPERGYSRDGNRRKFERLFMQINAVGLPDLDRLGHLSAGTLVLPSCDGADPGQKSRLIG